MAAKKWYLILFSCLLFCIGATDEAETPLSTEQTTLLDEPNPALAGIEEVYLIIECEDGEPNQAAVLQRQAEVKVREKLMETGIRTASKVKLGHVFTSVNTPELKVDIDLLGLGDSGRYAYHVQTSLASKVCFEKGSSRFIKADVWKSGTVMGAAEAEGISEEVTGVVLEQVAAFLQAYNAANVKSASLSEAAVGSTDEKEAVGAVGGAATAESKYVASKNSKVFHKAECEWARKIRPENLVGYSSREEAVQAGRRPCMQCKP